MARFTLLARGNVIGRFAFEPGAVMTKYAGLGYLGMIYPHDFLPVERVVATLASIGGGNMILRFKGGIQRATGHVAQLALAGGTGKYTAFVAAVALQVPVRPAQFKTGGEVIKRGLFSPGRARRKP